MTDFALSPFGLEFVARWEGFVGHVYNDADRPPNATIGYGHLLHQGPVTPTDLAAWHGGITEANARKLLRHDTLTAVAAVKRAVRVPLSQAMIDALTSTVVNCGPGCLDGQIGRAVNARPSLLEHPFRLADWHQQVTDALLLYDHGNKGVVIPGLWRRRMSEARLFVTGKYTVSAGNPYSNWQYA